MAAEMADLDEMMSEYVRQTINHTDVSVAYVAALSDCRLIICA